MAGIKIIEDNISDDKSETDGTSPHPQRDDSSENNVGTGGEVGHTSEIVSEADEPNSNEEGTINDVIDNLE